MRARKGHDLGEGLAALLDRRDVARSQGYAARRGAVGDRGRDQGRGGRGWVVGRDGKSWEGDARPGKRGQSGMGEIGGGAPRGSEGTPPSGESASRSRKEVDPRRAARASG